MQQEETKFRNGKIVRGEAPLNLEMPFEKLDGFITPIESFYVRCHFPIPNIERKSWRLRIEGEVERPFEFGYDDLLKFETRTLPVTLECAGNSRNFLEPKVKGVAWGLGAVGNAEWTGVPLSVLLELAGATADATEVILEGADTGPVEEAKRPAGNVRFARSVPLAKARADVLLAYKMNGKELPQEHGFPVRAIVPGWYAVASVKWLERILVTDKPFSGFYQTIDYSYWKTRGDLPQLAPIQQMEVKAEIAQPTANEVLRAGSDVLIRGAAWTGESEITRVEVSTDAGATWKDARLTEQSNQNAWRLWDYAWRTPSRPGTCALVARATDSKGRIQPVERDANRGTYMISHLLPITVEVR
jgi:DMSO/TMAO reductase YedYZ molybdopterin-dependent catalytic subunit